MPLSMMQPLTRPPSRDLTPPSPTRRLSREVTYQLAESARRKSSDKVVRDDLRLKLSHDHLLELLLQDIARSEWEAQTAPTEEKYLMEDERKGNENERPQQRRHEAKFDECGFPLDDEDGEEDLGGLSLMRTESRRPTR